jgi:hypothetical protein
MNSLNCSRDYLNELINKCVRVHSQKKTMLLEQLDRVEQTIQALENTMG